MKTLEKFKNYIYVLVIVVGLFISLFTYMDNKIARASDFFVNKDTFKVLLDRLDNMDRKLDRLIEHK